jgi:hypothetical protein
MRKAMGMVLLGLGGLVAAIALTVGALALAGDDVGSVVQPTLRSASPSGGSEQSRSPSASVDDHGDDDDSVTPSPSVDDHGGGSDDHSGSGSGSNSGSGSSNSGSGSDDD